MALRNQISEEVSAWEDPVLGLNLRDSAENLKPGESQLLQNVEVYGSVRMRRGSQRINEVSLGDYPIRGGIMYYYGGASPQRKNVIAYHNRLSILSGAGVETVLASSLHDDADVFMVPWSITDKLYISNNSDVLAEYDGNTGQFQTVVGSNIPTPRGFICPVNDRLLAITTDGIERTDPRVTNVWSHNSSWATLRPSQPGLFTTLHPVSLKSTDTIQAGALAFQEKSYYLIYGTDYGDDVTESAPPAGEDVKMQLLDGEVGTASPYSVCTVPGVGIFWFTTDANIYWIPEGGLTGRYIGDKLQSTVATLGINNVNFAALNQVWITYHDRMLMVGIPVRSNRYSTVQFWMDMYSLTQHPDRGAVWYGPMTNQSLSRAWHANRQGDNALYGGEGNPGEGAFVYRLRVNGRYSDAVGTADLPLQIEYMTPPKSAGTPSREKYLQAVHVDANSFTGHAAIDILDLDGALATDVPLIPVTS